MKTERVSFGLLFANGVYTLLLLVAMMGDVSGGALPLAMASFLLSVSLILYGIVLIQAALITKGFILIIFSYIPAIFVGMFVVSRMFPEISSLPAIGTASLILFGSPLFVIPVLIMIAKYLNGRSFEKNLK